MRDKWCFTKADYHKSNNVILLVSNIRLLSMHSVGELHDKLGLFMKAFKRHKTDTSTKSHQFDLMHTHIRFCCYDDVCSKKRAREKNTVATMTQHGKRGRCANTMSRMCVISEQLQQGIKSLCDVLYKPKQ
jgi:hypothetical protein